MENSSFQKRLTLFRHTINSINAQVLSFELFRKENRWLDFLLENVSEIIETHQLKTAGANFGKTAARTVTVSATATQVVAGTLAVSVSTGTVSGTKVAKSAKGNYNASVSNGNGSGSESESELRLVENCLETIRKIELQLLAFNVFSAKSQSLELFIKVLLKVIEKTQAARPSSSKCLSNGNGLVLPPVETVDAGVNTDFQLQQGLHFKSGTSAEICVNTDHQDSIKSTTTKATSIHMDILFCNKATHTDDSTKAEAKAKSVLDLKKPAKPKSTVEVEAPDSCNEPLSTGVAEISTTCISASATAAVNKARSEEKEDDSNSISEKIERDRDSPAKKKRKKSTETESSSHHSTSTSSSSSSSSSTSSDATTRTDSSKNSRTDHQQPNLISKTKSVLLEDLLSIRRNEYVFSLPDQPEPAPALRDALRSVKARFENLSNLSNLSVFGEFVQVSCRAINVGTHFVDCTTTGMTNAVGVGQESHLQQTLSSVYMFDRGVMFHTKHITTKDLVEIIIPQDYVLTVVAEFQNGSRSSHKLESLQLRLGNKLGRWIREQLGMKRGNINRGFKQEKSSPAPWFDSYSEDLTETAIVFNLGAATEKDIGEINRIFLGKLTTIEP